MSNTSATAVPMTSDESDDDPVQHRRVKARSAPRLVSTGVRSVFDQARPALPVPFDLSAVEIEQGVQMPTGWRGNASPYLSLFERLSVGDSAALPIDRMDQARQAYRYYAKTRGGTFTVRKVSDTECRLWRLS